MGVDERSKETFCVIPRSRQLFYDIRLAGLSRDKVRRNVRDMNTVGSSVTVLEEATSSARRIVEMFGYIG